VSILKLEGVFVLFKETLGEVKAISPLKKGICGRSESNMREG